MHLNEEKILSEARSFFLGKMTEGERAGFETAFVSDPDIFDLVRVSEDELVEEYVRGMLSRDDKRSFETNYLSVTANARKVEVTRGLIAKFADSRPSVESVSFFDWMYALVFQNKLALGSAFGIVLILAGLWFVLPRASSPEIAKEQTPEVVSSPSPPIPSPVIDPASNPVNTGPTSTPAPKIEEKPLEKPPEPQPKTPVLALFAGTLRSGGNMPTLVVDGNVKSARLSLNLESLDYDRYRAEIVDPDGTVVYRSGTLRPAGKNISLAFPTGKVISGEFSVRLSGITKANVPESAADFAFRITRK